MFLIVGLGNPGKQFRGTRHNIGFSILNTFRIKEGFSNWKLEKKFKAKTSEGSLGEKKILLAKPQAFMNSSGQSVKLLVTRYALRVTNLFVVHDDLDIPLGKMKISKTRGSAGHRGVQSVIDTLETKEFARARIGINHGTWNMEYGTKRDKFVLEKFSKEERKIIREVKKRACEALEVAIEKGIEEAMNEFNC